MKTLSQYKKEKMKNPVFKNLYDSYELEYQLISLVIKARKEKNITQRKLALLMRTPQSVIARFESGKANPTLSFIEKLTKALGVRLKLVV